MARPVQPLGTFGKVSVRRAKAGYVASTRFREFNGSYRRVTANADTATAAVNALMERIAAGLPSQAEGDLSGQTRLKAVADVWLAQIEARQEHAPQTIDVYRDIVNRIVLPAIGELRLNELTVGTLDRFLKAEAERGYSRGRHARVVLVQILDLAVRHDAMPTNPVRSTAPLRRSRSEIRSLTLEELAEIRRLLREHRKGLPGPPPDGQPAQVFEVMLGTSARLGEALAIRCGDVDLNVEQPTVTIAGTIVYVRGEGFIRQSHPKHSKYWRTVTELRGRRPARAAGHDRRARPQPDRVPHQAGHPAEPGERTSPVAFDPRRQRRPAARRDRPRPGRAPHAAQDRGHDPSTKPPEPISRRNCWATRRLR